MKRGRGDQEGGPSRKKQAPQPFKQLKVEDALAYLDQVKQQFAHAPHVYNQFLDIMKDFKSQAIDTPGVIARVSELFKGHKSLVLGFNTFLPPGYKIELPEEEQSAEKPAPAAQSQAQASTSQAPKTANKQAIDFDHAIHYVTKIKGRFAHQPEIYKTFLDILHTYQKEQYSIKRVYDQVSELFKDQPDLLQEFAQFLPSPAAQPQAAPAKRSTQATQQSTKSQRTQKHAAQAKKTQAIAETGNRPSRKRNASKKAEESIRKQSNIEETAETYRGFEEPESLPAFFEKVKQRLKNSDAYAQFLKCVNLYSQEIVTKQELLSMTEDVIGKFPELMRTFKRLLSVQSSSSTSSSSNSNIERVSKEDVQKMKYGPSYRTLPKHFPHSKSSGRTALCAEVLNDELVSVPAGSEESRDTYKKTQFDEIIFQCEDDRCELDIVIEQNISTIRFLEPIAQRLATDDTFRFKIDLLRDIHKASIGRIYGERGNEILEGLRRNPTVAIPIILKRLRQKDEEWRATRRDLNKFWREVYEKNHIKSLEAQAATFKQTDKKTISAKTLENDIEQRHEFHKSLNFVVERESVHANIVTLLFQYLETRMSADEIDKVRKFWRSFVIPFFGILQPAPQSDTQTSTTEPNTNQTETNETQAEPSYTKIVRDIVKLHEDDDTKTGRLYAPLIEQRVAKSLPPVQIFYGNKTLYLFMRLYQILHERLFRARELADRIIRTKRRTDTGAAIVREHDNLAAGIMPSATDSKADDDLYDLFLGQLTQFLAGSIDVNKFETECKNLLGAESYILSTLDKVLAAISKQITNLITDEMSTMLINAYDYERRRVNSFVDNSYSIHALKIIGEETCFCFEFRQDNHKLEISIVEPPVIDPEKELAEEKGYLYIEDYINSHAASTESTETTEEKLTRTSKIALKRNLQRKMPMDASSVTISNGLEYKICIKTLKIFYVEETEDYYHRRRPSPQAEKKAAIKQTRASRFDSWLEKSNATATQNASEASTTTTTTNTSSTAESTTNEINNPAVAADPMATDSAVIEGGDNDTAMDTAGATATNNTSPNQDVNVNSWTSTEQQQPQESMSTSS